MQPLQLYNIYRVLLITSYGLLVLSFAAAYGAAYIDPRSPFWWMQVLAVGLPYMALLLLAFTPFLFGRRLRFLLPVHFVVLAAFAVRVMPITGTSDPPAETLRILSFNVKEVDKSINAQEATHRLSEMYAPDIAALQGRPMSLRRGEVSAVALSIAGFLYDHRYHTTIPENLPHGEFHSPVLVRNNMSEEVPVVRRQDTVELPGIEYRVVTRAEVEWQGHVFAVYNFHLQSFALKPWRWSRSRLVHLDIWRYILGAVRNDFQIRADQADLVKEMLEDEELPFIVCGDFNSTPHNWEFRRIASGLTDVQRVGRIFPRSTYHARYPLIRIDHILVSKEWRVHSADILPRTFSDHLPLLAVISLESND